MKNKLFGAALLISSLPLFFCGCDDDDNGGEQEITDIPVVLTGKTYSFDPKDGGTKWENGKKIGVYMMEEDGKTIVDPYQNIQYQSIVSPEGYFAPVNNDDVIYFDQNGGKSNLIAYYPYKADLKEKKDLLAVDVSNQKSASALNILYSANCKGANKDNNKVEMQLRPILSEITFTLTAGEGVTDEYLEDAVVTLKGMPTKADFNIISGQFENYSDVKDIAMIHKKAKLDTALVIASASVEGYIAHVKLPKMGNREYTWEIKEKISELKQGICYNCTGTVGLEDMDVEMTEEPISDWGDGGSNSEGSVYENWIEKTINDLPLGVMTVESVNDKPWQHKIGEWIFVSKKISDLGIATVTYEPLLEHNVIHCGKVSYEPSWYSNCIAYRMQKPNKEIYTLKFKIKGTNGQQVKCFIFKQSGEFIAIITDNAQYKGAHTFDLTEEYKEYNLNFDFTKICNDVYATSDQYKGEATDEILESLFIQFAPTKPNTEMYLYDVSLELKKN